MRRREFLGAFGETLVIAGATYYGLSDKSNLVRADVALDLKAKTQLTKNEQRILYLASLAPSGHNTQPWFIRHIEPLHWIICNGKSKLPIVRRHYKN